VTFARLPWCGSLKTSTFQGSFIWRLSAKCAYFFHQDIGMRVGREQSGLLHRYARSSAKPKRI